MNDDREKMLTDHHRPDGSDDATVSAVGSVSEALEWVERARGHLYTFHQLMGHADLQFGSAADELRDAGHGDAADALEREVIGRNVIEGRWTFQMVEDFDDGYYRTFADAERRTRDRLLDGRRHVYESQLKERNRTQGRPGHEARPEA